MDERRETKRIPFALYGVVLFGVALVMYVVGVFLGFPRNIFFPGNETLTWINRAIVLYSGIPVILGVALIVVDIYVFRPRFRNGGTVRFDPPGSRDCTVVLTAYNDEDSIGESVRDFLGHPDVRRVIVVSNNSTDATLERAAEAGAEVLNECVQGYGACVHRALREGASRPDTELTVLCEGDMTFRAADLDKFFAYIPHADIVIGTRTVDQLQDERTQVTPFIHYGNTFVGKLLEMKHIGRCTLSDVGTTYKMCRNDALLRLLNRLDFRNINLEFNAYFMDRALEAGLAIVECPITFHQRVGVSKGGNINSFVAFRLGLRMMRGILFGWWDEEPRDECSTVTTTAEESK
ncbi:hypothetical protein GGQ74_002354 [Desulfobaculum xiamenense]|uniref:Glycosyltransferase 2-like domain-containing protein n=1 Tax=Desulfobaculum xiamenense TaxID=995050 RepID=A0A846QKM5_9BACT|nr:glycosyltransferase [Desulfobaculum xiamenense]NJB68681.1 hypothetical protein [Desulfobaculum xiamenense]